MNILRSLTVLLMSFGIMWFIFGTVHNIALFMFIGLIKCSLAALIAGWEEEE